jgi:HD-GYP domain-containing protein (c-di-GMP phosphodiesterase class II)
VADEDAAIGRGFSHRRMLGHDHVPWRTTVHLVTSDQKPPTLRLAELVATLSLGTDLGLGQPMEHIVQETIIALRMGERLGIAESDRAVLFYAGLLAWVGCHTDAYEQAKWFGDDIKMKADGVLIDEPSPGWLIGHLGAGRPALERLRLAAALPMAARRKSVVDLEAHWLAADGLAARLGLGDEVRQSLKETYERWDGKGAFGAKGEEIRLASRLIILADVVAVFHRAGGLEAAVAVARERSGASLDPALADLFCENAPAFLDGLDDGSSWSAVLDMEPSLAREVPDAMVDEALEAVADFTDLKSPFTIGHSRAVADLAAEAARAYGLDEGNVGLVRRAGLVHDIGRLGVTNGVWDKRGPLSGAQQERVRLHPYLTERMLAFAPALAPLGAIAVEHHERLDGSGYPRGLSGPAISPAGRVLGAADVYHAMLELRPHRPARTAEFAAGELRREVGAGRLDGDAVDAVLRAAGHRVARRRTWPAELTSREVDVLRLIARGFSNKEIADRLIISPKTAGNHVEHIYTKIGASNRARAALFAMRHGLMAEPSPLNEG